MGDDGLAPVLAVEDVLPTGVRRRWGRADALLPAVLAGELLAGVLLGMAWEVASTPPALRLVPPASVVAGSASTSTSTVVVPPPALPPAPPPPPRRTVPRNPFEVQPG